MGLPVGEQRVLDEIEDSLRVSEPRLASMYAIFARLTHSDGRPLREQLPSISGARRAFGRLFQALSLGRYARAGRSRRSRPFAKALLICNFVLLLAVLGLLIGLNMPGGQPGCSTSQYRSVVVPHSAGSACRAQAVLGSQPIPK